MKFTSHLKRSLINPISLKGALVLASAALISACSVSDLKPDFEKPSFYLLDKSDGDFCRGFDSNPEKTQCKSVILTNFYHIETQVIENIYQQEITGPNRVLSLMNIIISGDNADYRAQQLSNGYYKLPITQQTDTVWEVLTNIEEEQKRR